MTQVAGERLAYKTLIMAGKKLKMPSLSDMVERYAKLYDDMNDIVVDKFGK